MELAYELPRLRGGARPADEIALSLGASDLPCQLKLPFGLDPLGRRLDP